LREEGVYLFVWKVINDLRGWKASRTEIDRERSFREAAERKKI